MTAGLTTQPPPRPPQPARVLLPPEHWAALAAEARALPLLPPFDTASGPVLDAEQHERAVRELRASRIVVADTGRLLADLHPSVLATLAVGTAPLLRVDSAVRRGAEQVVSAHAATATLALGLRRTLTADGQPTDGEQRLLLGPVELTTLLLEQLATEVVAGLGVTAGPVAREPVRLEAAASLAAVRALDDGREQVAREVVRGDLPPVLRSLAGGVRAVARVDVTSPGRRQVLVLLGTEQGWWSVRTAGDEVLLRPVDEDAVVTDVAAAVAAVLGAGG